MVHVRSFVLTILIVVVLSASAASAVAQGSAATPEAVATGSSPVEFAWQTGGGPEPLAAPVDLAVDSEGTVGRRQRQQPVPALPPDGRFLETWGTPGDGPGEFNFLVEPPHHGIGSVAFGPGGRIYVADWANFRIQKFDRERTFVTAWGTEGTGDGQSLSPISVAVDGTGNVYVVDDGRDDIQKFDADGTFLLTFRGRGTAEGQLFSSGYLTVDDAGNIWVADSATTGSSSLLPTAGS